MESCGDYQEKFQCLAHSKEGTGKAGRCARKTKSIMTDDTIGRNASGTKIFLSPSQLARIRQCSSHGILMALSICMQLVVSSPRGWFLRGLTESVFCGIDILEEGAEKRRYLSQHRVLN